MDMSRIQRALGLIEGVCAGLADKPAELIECAVNEIDCELVAGGGTVAMQDRTSDYDSGNGNDVCINQCGDSVDLLISRLLRCHKDYLEGRVQNFELLCEDAENAAAEILRLRMVIQDLECRSCLEHP